MTSALYLKSISQSSTELWPKIGFDHIWQSVDHLELDGLEKNISAVHFEVLNIILQFQLNPSSGSLVIAAEKSCGRTDRQTDGQDKNIYASSLLGRGIKDGRTDRQIDRQTDRQMDSLLGVGIISDKS